jgi:glycine/D-amino acid oxidase-like deaminating enzyme
MGETNARQLVEDRWSGLQLLRKRLGDSNLEYFNHGGYELLSGRDLHLLDKMDRVNELLKPIFHQPVFSVRNQSIGGFGFIKARVASLIRNPFEGQLNPGAMMKSLIDLAREKGIDYLTGAKVGSVNPESDAVRVIVGSAHSEDLKFLCRRVAVCTNAFTNSLLPELKITPGRGTILVTTPIKALKFKGVFHYNEGFFYFRNAGSRVIFGGGRNLDTKGEETLDFGFNEQIVDHLKKRA